MANSKPFKVVVLDFDGVVMETVDIKTDGFRWLFSEYGEEAVEYIVAYHLKHGGMSRIEKFRYFFETWLKRSPESGEFQAMNRRFQGYCLEKVTGAEFVPGAVGFLQFAHGRWPLYVASGVAQEELDGIVEKRQLGGYFVGVYGSPEKKPSMLQRIIEERGIEPDELLMVGDSRTDLEAALAVSACFYGRGDFSGYPCGEDLSGLGAYVAAGRGQRA